MHVTIRDMLHHKNSSEWKKKKKTDLQSMIPDKNQTKLDINKN